MLPEQVKEDPPQVTVKSCPECASLSATDNRNEHFCRLLNEELKYIQPCMRTRCYVKILNFLRTLLNEHTHNIEVSETEKQ